MSPRDRKFFAQAFADDDTVEVRALGAGFYRRVSLLPPAWARPLSAAAEASGGRDEDVEEAETGFGGTEAEQ